MQGHPCKMFQSSIKILLQSNEDIKKLDIKLKILKHYLWSNFTVFPCGVVCLVHTPISEAQTKYTQKRWALSHKTTVKDFYTVSE